MQKRPPVPAMLPSSSGAATTPGNSSTARSTRAAIRPARSRFRHACSGAPAQRGGQLVCALSRARLHEESTLAPRQRAQEAGRGALPCCALGRAGVREAGAAPWRPGGRGGGAGGRRPRRPAGS